MLACNYMDRLSKEQVSCVTVRTYCITGHSFHTKNGACSLRNLWKDCWSKFRGRDGSTKWEPRKSSFFDQFHFCLVKSSRKFSLNMTAKRWTISSGPCSDYSKTLLRNNRSFQERASKRTLEKVDSNDLAFHGSFFFVSLIL